ncbi:class F sortase [Streptomyces sp. NPDC006339]|uniref:class F sortase n=1 Tax=Streptomyces sp. NPDC006339 TaxID=3156755 RepID=UPI0033B42E40
MWGASGPTGGRPGRPGAWGLVAVVLLVGVHLVRGGAGEWPAEGPPQPAAVAAPGRGAAGTGAAPDPLPASPPLRVRVPAVRIDASVTRVGLDGDGWIEAPPPPEPSPSERGPSEPRPSEPGPAGWFTASVTPGERGTAVVVGHVDTPAGGPAVFYDLGAVVRGQRVEVARADGRTAVFTVYGIEVVPLDDFPSERIYGSTGAPELRLITCGGPYAPGGGYESNLVVSARLTEVR